MTTLRSLSSLDQLYVEGCAHESYKWKNGLRTWHAFQSSQHCRSQNVVISANSVSIVVDGLVSRHGANDQRSLSSTCGPMRKETGNTLVRSPPRTASPVFARPSAGRNNQWQCHELRHRVKRAVVRATATDGGILAWAKLDAASKRSSNVS